MEPLRSACAHVVDTQAGESTRILPEPNPSPAAPSRPDSATLNFQLRGAIVHRGRRTNTRGYNAPRHCVKAPASVSRPRTKDKGKTTWPGPTSGLFAMKSQPPG